jgi:hypothetical protein
MTATVASVSPAAHCGRDFTIRSASAFSGYRWPADVILMAVRWYLRHPLSSTSVMELLAERGIDVSNRTVLRWVQAFGRGWRLKLANIVGRSVATGTPTRCSSFAARTSGTCTAYGGGSHDRRHQAGGRVIISAGGQLVRAAREAR